MVAKGNSRLDVPARRQTLKPLVKQSYACGDISSCLLLTSLSEFRVSVCRKQKAILRPAVRMRSESISRHCMNRLLPHCPNINSTEIWQKVET